MPLSLTTQRKQQTLCVKWSTQQHPAQLYNTEIAAANTNIFRLHQHHSNYRNQPLRKQKSLKENLHLNKTFLTTHTRRASLSSGLSVGRSHDIQRSSFNQKVLKKHSSITAQSHSEKNEREVFKKSDLIKGNITTSEQSNSGKLVGNSGEFLKNSRKIQAWPSTSSILKTLDKELAQLNNAAGSCKNIKPLKDPLGTVEANAKGSKPKACPPSTSGAGSSHSNGNQIKSEPNKVNLNIILSHASDSTKEQNDVGLSDREVDEEDSDGTSSSSTNVLNSSSKPNNNKKSEKLSNSFKNTTATRPNITAQQRRSLYHSSRLSSNLTLSNNNSNNIVALNSDIPNLTTCSSLTVQKRPPLIRAMSAPVYGFDETKKGPFLSNKKISRRRKINSRNKSCDKDFELEPKSTINRKVLTRSKSVASDVVTLVSLINSEGSDSEKEDNSLTCSNSHTGSPHRRAPSLRKSGKSVSFQENYPPTFQFASKEYSHMLRRGSIAPLAQRINSNRPPTAPPGSIYHTTQKLYNVMPDTKAELSEERERKIECIKNNEHKTLAETINEKPLDEMYEYPVYVRSIKERECWKLFIKMSQKGVNITYDTISRGMLTPTEFRQLQKQRDVEEAKALKAADNSLAVETTTRSSTAIERLKESLLRK